MFACAAIVVALALMLGCRGVIGPRMRATTARTVERTAGRLARGKYLAENVSACMECHTPHDAAARVSPMTAGRIGSGQLLPLDGMPGRVVAPNLTPDPETGAGNWTDDQLSRAIREGIGHDGRALFPGMPYERFRSLSDEDLASIIVYLRALPPVRNALPPTKLNADVRMMIRELPRPVRGPVPEPDISTPGKRGAYLAEVGACADCHTPMTGHGRRMHELEFGGGFVLKGVFGRVASANITPDPSGIPYYDTQIFMDAMRKGLVGARELNPIMPWTTYGGMTDQDLSAILDYLKTLRPVSHRVDNTEAMSYCKRCKQKHGLGERN
jgi:mono/diheme cytochrome c family protein